MAYTPDNIDHIQHIIRIEHKDKGSDNKDLGDYAEAYTKDSLYPVIEEREHHMKVFHDSMNVTRAQAKKTPTQLIVEWRPKSTFRLLDLKQYEVSHKFGAEKLIVGRGTRIPQLQQAAKLSADQEESEGMQALIAAVGKEKAYKYAKLANAFKRTSVRDKQLNNAQRRQEYLVTNQMDV